MKFLCALRVTPGYFNLQPLFHCTEILGPESRLKPLGMWLPESKLHIEADIHASLTLEIHELFLFN